MKHYIFGYGTLVNKKTRDKTGDSGSALICFLKGYRRRWNYRSNAGHHALGVEVCEGGRCLGMLIEVPERELYKFDKREFNYHRVQVAPEELEQAEEALPEGVYWLYIPKEPLPPSQQSPIPQSMVDVIMQAYLEHDEKWAGHFIENTEDWHFPWVNDRHEPLYPRYLEGMPHERIDALLEKHHPQAFAGRKEMAPAVNPGLQESILKTLRYFDLFDFPLTAEEVQIYLYRYPHSVHIKEIRGSLRQMAAMGRLREIKEHYTFPGREKTVETRKTRKFIAEKLWNRTKLYGQYMRAVPFVRMIGVCNTLSYDNPNEHSDIDLLIVVEPGRMWLARLLITLILQFYGVRRHGDKIAGRFCLSFFVTTEKMNMEPLQIEPEDPYLAYWTLFMTPIYGQAVYHRFRQENEGWLASEYGLCFSEKKEEHLYYLKKESSLKRFCQWLLGGWLGDRLESLLRKTFKKRTLRRLDSLGPEANVIVTDDMLKFHNHDRRREYYERWIKQLAQNGR